MSRTISFGGVAVNIQLHAFVTQEAMPGTGIVEADFWQGLAALVRRMAPLNDALLRRRDELQAQIDAWHRGASGTRIRRAELSRAICAKSATASRNRRRSRSTPPASIRRLHTLRVRSWSCPVNNARYALNAANARWGSLYDALYGTDVIAADGAEANRAEYNPKRGALVIGYVRGFLDDYFPLRQGSHRDALGYRLGARPRGPACRTVRPRFALDDALVGYRGEPDAPSTLLLVHHGLHVEIHIDREHPIGRGDAAGISDVVLESAMTTIEDFEDSVAAVDVEEKVAVYRNWLGLMTGTLTAAFDKGGRQLCGA
jgi:malate synthase